MTTVTEDDVRETFEGSDEDVGYEVLNVERNRSQYRVFLTDEDVSRPAVEELLAAAYGADSVFGVDVTDDRQEGREQPVRVVSFRLR